MDDYDPACPTEDEPQLNLDLSLVPLPPSSPGQNTRRSEGNEDESREGKRKKKKKHEKSHERHREIMQAEKNTKDISGSSNSHKEPFQATSLKGREDIPNLEIIKDISSTDLVENEPPSLLPEAAHVSASTGSLSSVVTPSSSETGLPSKTQFKLASDPGSGKSKVLFQLSGKSTKVNPLKLVADEEEEEKETGVMEEVQQNIEKTIAGEYMPTRFKKSKKHEIFKPSQGGPNLTIVFNSDSIVSSSSLAPPPHYSSMRSEPDREDFKTSCKKVKDAGAKHETEDSKSVTLRRSDRMAARKESREEERKNEENSNSSRSRQRDSSSSSRRPREKSNNDSYHKSVEDEKITRRRSSRFNSEDSDDIKNKGSESSTTPRLSHRHEASSRSHRRTRNSRKSLSQERDKSPSQSKNKKMVVSSKTLELEQEKSDFLLENQNAGNLNQSAQYDECFDTDSTKRKDEEHIKEDLLEMPTNEKAADKGEEFHTLVKDAAVVSAPSSNEDDGSKKPVQKLVIRRSTETNDFQVTRNDLAESSCTDSETAELHSPVKKSSKEREKSMSDTVHKSKEYKSKKHHGHKGTKHTSKKEQRHRTDSPGTDQEVEEKDYNLKKSHQHGDSPTKSRLAISQCNEPPLHPEQVLVDVSAIPGKSKWEMEEEDETGDAGPTVAQSLDSQVKAETLPVKTYETSDVSWRRLTRLKADRSSKTTSGGTSRSSMDEDVDTSKSIDKKRHKNRDKKTKKKKHRHDDSSEEENPEPEVKHESKKVIEDRGASRHSIEEKKMEAKKKEEPSKQRAEIDTKKLVTYLKEYSEKEEFTFKEDITKPKTEPDKMRIATYLKEYSKMSTETGQVSSEEDKQQSSGATIHINESSRLSDSEKKDDVDLEPQDLDSSKYLASVDARKELDKCSEKKEETQFAEQREIRYRPESLEQNQEVKQEKWDPDKEKMIMERSKSPEESRNKQESSESAKEKARDRKRDRSKSQEKVREKRERSKSQDRKRDRSKSQEKVREKRERSKSLDKTRERRERSKSSEPVREKRDRPRSKDKQDKPNSPEKNRGRDRSRSADRNRLRKNRSKSRDRRERSKSVDKYRRGYTSQRSRSPRRLKGRRNRSRSDSTGRNVRDRKNKSRSRSMSFERGNSNRWRRSPFKSRSDRRRRSRSNSSERHKLKRHGSSEESYKKRLSVSPDKIPHKEIKASKKISEESTSKQVESVVIEFFTGEIDLSSIPIPGEIPLPGEVQDVVKSEENQQTEDVPMDISDQESSPTLDHKNKEEIIITGDSASCESQLPIMKKSEEKTSVTEIQHADVASKDSQPASKEKQIKFSIVSKKTRPLALASDIALDDHSGLKEKLDENKTSALEMLSKEKNTTLTPFSLASNEEPLEAIDKLGRDDDNKDDKNNAANKGKKKLQKAANIAPDAQTRSLKFKYVPLWEMEESESRPTLVEAPKKSLGSLSLALDYGTDSSDSDNDERKEADKTKMKPPDVLTPIESGVSNNREDAKAEEFYSDSLEKDKTSYSQDKEESNSDYQVEVQDEGTNNFHAFKESQIQSYTVIHQRQASFLDHCFNEKNEDVKQTSQKESTEQEVYSPSHPSLEDADDIIEANPRPDLIKLPAKSEAAAKSTSILFPVPSIASSLKPIAASSLAPPFTLPMTTVVPPSMDVPVVSYPRLPLSALAATNQSVPGYLPSGLISDMGSIPLPASTSQPAACPLPTNVATMPVTYPILPLSKLSQPKPVPPPLAQLTSGSMWSAAMPTSYPSLPQSSIGLQGVPAPPLPLGPMGVQAPSSLQMSGVHIPMPPTSIQPPHTMIQPIPPHGVQPPFIQPITQVVHPTLAVVQPTSTVIQSIPPPAVQSLPPPMIQPPIPVANQQVLHEAHSVPPMSLQPVVPAFPLQPSSTAQDVTDTTFKDSETPPVQKFRICRFDQGPTGLVTPQAIPPPMLVSIPVLQPPGVVLPQPPVVALPVTTSIASASSTPPIETGFKGTQKSIKKDSQPSKRPKISSIFSQPKIDDTKVLELLSKGEADIKSLPLLLSTMQAAAEKRSEWLDSKLGVEKNEETVKLESPQPAEISQPSQVLQPPTFKDAEIKDEQKKSPSAFKCEAATESKVFATELAETIAFDMSSIPLPDDPPRVDKPAPDLKADSHSPPHVVSTESAGDINASSSPQSLQPPLPPCPSTPTEPEPEASTLSFTKDQKEKKRFNQSPLAIGLLPKIPLIQSPLAIGPLPKIVPEQEESSTNKNILSQDTGAKKSSLLLTELKQKTLTLSASPLLKKLSSLKDEAKPSLPGSKIHIVLKSKSTVQKTLVPGFEDEGSDQEVAAEEAVPPEPLVESEILSALKEDSEEPFGAEDESRIKITMVKENKEEKQQEQTSVKFMTPAEMEAYPVQVITSSRKEEHTPASTWPEFTAGKEERTKETDNKSSEVESMDKRDEERRDEDNDQTPTRDEGRKRSEEDVERNESKRRREEDRSSRRKEDEKDRRKMKEKDEESYDDRRKGSDRYRDDKYNRRRGRDDERDYSRKRSRHDDDDRRRSQYDKDDNRRSRKFDEGSKRYSERSKERDRSRERSRERDRSRVRSRERERSKERDKSYSRSRSKRNRDRSHSRSPSPQRKKERSKGHDRYDREDRARDVSRSRSSSSERARPSRDEHGSGYSSKRKDSRSFKEEIMEEYNNTSGGQDSQEDLFKVTAIATSYASDYTPDPRFPLESNYLPDPSLYPAPPPTVDVPPPYLDPNYACQYPPAYENQQFLTNWQGQPGHEPYSLDPSGQYPPLPPDYQTTLPHAYSYHQPPPEVLYSPQIPPPPFTAPPYHLQGGLVPPMPHTAQQPVPSHLHHSIIHPPPSISLDQQVTPVHIPPPPQAHLPASPYHPSGAPHLQGPPPPFSKDSSGAHYAATDAQFSMLAGVLHGPMPPVRSPLLQAQRVSHVATDTVASGFGSPRFSSPPQVKQLEFKSFRKTKNGQQDDRPASDSLVANTVVSTSEAATVTPKRPSGESSCKPEPSFENSSLAEAEFDAPVSQEVKPKKKVSAPLEDVNEPTVTSSSIEDTTGDTGSDSGTDTSSQRPLKVKSRWRRNSEAEAVVDTSTPPLAAAITSHASSSKVASPPPVSSPVEMRRTRSRAAAEELSSTPLAETPPPPPPPRKRPKIEMDPIGLEEMLEEEKKTPDDPIEEQSLEELMKRPDFPKFEIISENIHLTERKRSKSMKRMLCDCTTCKEDRIRDIPACGSDCLNRMLMIECGSRCPCGEYCTNRRFQRKIYSKTIPFSAGDKGWGLRAEQDMEEKGTFIMEYVGELLDYEEFVRRTRQYSKEGRKHHYFMALNADEVVDATLKGNISRFINHSCEPNCETQKWTVNGELRVGFFTRQPVKKGEELTFDYQFEHYGEPQKCYCGAENCRGYIGLVKSPTRNNKKKEKKKREIFKDELLEEDIDKLSLLDGMRNKNNVLELCRLMVRAEKVQHRIAILKILQSTTEMACLRLFLDYHGLPLFWSWMADIGTADYSEDTQELKLLMLSVLKYLPITNKTVLKESKILDIVERWAVAAVAAARKPPPPPPPSSALPPSTADSLQEAGVLQMESSGDNEAVATPETLTAAPAESVVAVMPTPEPEPSTSSSENTPSSSPPPALPLPVTTVTPVSILASAKETKEAKQKRRVTFAEVHVETAFSPEPDEDMEENDNITSSTQYADDSSDMSIEMTSLGNPQVGAVADSTSQKDIFDLGDQSGISSDTDNSDTELVTRDPLASLAAECMSQWSSLKEIFKIPKKERVEERKRTERELDVLSKKIPEASDPFAKWKREKPKAFIRKKTTEEDEKKSSLPKMSKEERRQQFEAKVKAEDELAAQAAAEELQRQQEVYMLHQQRLMEDPAYFYSYHLQQGEFVSMEPGMVTPEGVIDPVTGQAVTSEAMVDPQTGQHYIGSLGQQLIDPSTGHPVIHIDPSTGQPMLSIDPSTGLSIDPSTGLPIDPSTGQPMLSIDPNTGQPMMHHQIDPQTGQPIDLLAGQHMHQTDLLTGQPILPTVDATANQLASLTGQQPIDPQTGQPLGQPLVHSLDILAGPPPDSLMDPVTGHLIHHSVFSYPAQSIPCVSVSLQPSQAPVKLPSTAHLPASSSKPGLSELDIEEEVPPPPSPPTVPVTKLPPNWKTAKDGEGRVYYYHAFTRHTQWEMPSWDEDDESINDMELDQLPPEDMIKQSKKKTTTAAADTSSEVARKIKDNFRIKMSDYIILYLNPYRKKDCKVGRISSTEDFKHLARKLTHHVMSKELKHCRHVEDLEVNENVKAKAKDYVRKYMSKFGANYKKTSSPQLD